LVKRIALAFLLLAFLGCVRGPRVAPSIKRRKEDLLQGISRSHERLGSLRGRGRIAVSTGKKTYSGNFSLRYKNPGKLRIDIYGPFGLQLLSVSVFDDSVLALLPSANLAFISHLSMPGVGGLGDVVTGDQFKELVTATVSLPGGPGAEEIKCNFKDKVATVIFSKSGYTNKLIVNPRTNAMLEREIYDDAGKILLTCYYRRFKSLKGWSRPYVVKIHEEETGKGLEMVYEEQNLNAKIENSEFQLNIPVGVEVIKN